MNISKVSFSVKALFFSYLILPAAQIVHPLSLAAAENLGLPKDCILVRASKYFESFLLLSHFLFSLAMSEGDLVSKCWTQ